MTICEVDSGSAGHWDRYLAERPDASIYHQYRWRRFFAEYFGKDTVYLMSRSDDAEVDGVLPLVRLRSVLFGDFLVSLPFVNYGGVIANSPQVTSQLIAKARDFASEFGCSHIEFRHTQQRVDLPCRNDKVAMLLELPRTPDELAKSIGSKKRSQIRRPRREKPDIRIGGVELLDSFYAVFSRNMRDLGTPVYSKSMFAYLLGSLPDSTRIVSISVAGEPAAAAFLIIDKDRVEIPWASSVRKYNPISINMLLYWEVLNYSILEGKRIFDFGRSTVGSGAHRFKAQWGAKPVPLSWHYWLGGEREIPQINPNNAKYQLAIKVWRKIPLPIANVLGPRIVRNLP